MLKLLHAADSYKRCLASNPFENVLIFVNIKATFNETDLGRRPQITEDGVTSN